MLQRFSSILGTNSWEIEVGVVKGHPSNKSIHCDPLLSKYSHVVNGPITGNVNPIGLPRVG